MRGSGFKELAALKVESFSLSFTVQGICSCQVVALRIGLGIRMYGLGMVSGSGVRCFLLTLVVGVRVGAHGACVEHWVRKYGSWFIGSGIRFLEFSEIRLRI